MKRYPKSLEILFSYLRKMPGVGKKTAERFGFQLIQWKKEDLNNFGKVLQDLTSKLSFCKQCGCLQEASCTFCESPTREKTSLCIVSSPRDIFLIEESGSFKGQYHALERLLSPIEGIDESCLRLKALEKRLENKEVKEVIFALESTVEGDATTLFLKKFLEKFSVTTTRIALGIPLGHSLEYTDEGTLARALYQRQKM